METPTSLLNVFESICFKKKYIEASEFFAISTIFIIYGCPNCIGIENLYLCSFVMLSF